MLKVLYLFNAFLLTVNLYILMLLFRVTKLNRKIILNSFYLNFKISYKMH